jgi:hypothetical protein
MEPPDDESPLARQFKAEQRQQRIYEIILRMVLWGEKSEDVFKKLEVNGFTGETAQKMYEKARRERVSAIRGDCWKCFGYGLLWVAVSVGIFLKFWEWGGIPTFLLIALWVTTCIGAWKMIKGVIGVFTARLKTGSLANEE